MLFGASVKVSLGKKQRRIDLIVEADNPQDAEVKAINQAKKMYFPGKKATYQLIAIVSETEAINTLETNQIITDNTIEDNNN
ncbi:MAG TPA: hypothetical protein PLH87_13260 [Bacillota bacterium]|jgi:hypothetical protein|nr:hypothetical protein [Bacillota bacterium]